jgi:hypothetical protein
MSIKQKLKLVWDSIIGNPQCCSQTESDYSNDIPEVKINIPELSEKDKLSKQIVDTVIEDLKKFPPSEWVVNSSVFSLYEHKCLSYSLQKISYNEVYMFQYGYTFFSEKDMERLYNAFYIPYQEAAQLRELERNKKFLTEFLDDTKRIKSE